MLLIFLVISIGVNLLGFIIFFIICFFLKIRIWNNFLLKYLLFYSNIFFFLYMKLVLRDVEIWEVFISWCICIKKLKDIYIILVINIRINEL